MSERYIDHWLWTGDEEPPRPAETIAAVAYVAVTHEEQPELPSPLVRLPDPAEGGAPTVADHPGEAALALNPHSPHALRLRAMLAIQGGEWQTAQQVEAQLAAAGENTSDLAFNIGVLQQRAGLHEQSVPTYKYALEQNPDFAEALLNLGHAFKTLGNNKDARSAWLAALAAKPELAAGYFKPWLEPSCPPYNSADTIRTST